MPASSARVSRGFDDLTLVDCRTGVDWALTLLAVDIQHKRVIRLAMKRTMCPRCGEHASHGRGQSWEVRGMFGGEGGDANIPDIIPPVGGPLVARFHGFTLDAGR